MRRVYFSRAERDDPFVLAKACIDEAAFALHAEALGCPVDETDESGEDNNRERYATFLTPALMVLFLDRLMPINLPVLVARVPAEELEYWEGFSRFQIHVEFEEWDGLK